MKIKVLKTKHESVTEKYYTVDELEKEKFVGVEIIKTNDHHHMNFYNGNRYMFTARHYVVGGDALGNWKEKYSYQSLINEHCLQLYVFSTANELYKWMSEQ